MTDVHAPARLGAALTEPDLRALQLAVRRLEQPTLAARVADYAGRPMALATQRLPRAWSRQLRNAVRVAIYRALELAVGSLGKDRHRPPSSWGPKLITGATGGLGGVFGLVALPVELPITTTLMLRAIAEIARSESEDPKNIETSLACLEVFALGGRAPSAAVSLDYYAVRTMLAQLTGEVAALVIERGAVNASAPVVARLVGEIAGRFGLIVTDRVIAGAAPVLGAVGGATVNMIFMDHFQRVALGHFTVRRLERVYGRAVIRPLYEQTAGALAAERRRPARRRKPGARARTTDG
jgi:hypothetical protein